MPANRIFLHIGAPKTGTTYLQSLLSRNRSELAELGLLYPHLHGDAHHKAAWDLRGIPPQRAGIEGVAGSWQRVVDEVNATDGDALLSSEHFLFAKERDARRATSAFEGEVHIIYTARDLVRQVPAVWQERVKNQHAVSFRDFMTSIMGGGGVGAKAFWRAQDATEVLRVWSDDRYPSRTHVVTAPPSGSAPDVLWNRFASVLGLDGSQFDTSAAGSANTSLTMTQTELLRRFNERFGEHVPWVDYRRIVKGELRSALASIDDDRKITLTEAELAYFTTQAGKVTAALSEAGYDVAGDLAELQPSAGVLTAAQSREPVPEGDLLSAALDVIHALVTRSLEGAEHTSAPRGDSGRRGRQDVSDA